MARLKYPFLWAWDRKLASNMEWSAYGQELAEKHNAPLDVLYFKVEDEVPTWTTYSGLERFEVKHEMWQRVTNMGYDAGPEPTEDDFRVEIEGRDCTQAEAEKIYEINRLVAEWIEHAECGETGPDGCTTCEVGVAIGVKVLNDAYQAGYKAGALDERSKAKEI